MVVVVVVVVVVYNVFLRSCTLKSEFSLQTENPDIKAKIVASFVTLWPNATSTTLLSINTTLPMNLSGSGHKSHCCEPRRDVSTVTVFGSRPSPHIAVRNKTVRSKKKNGPVHHSHDTFKTQGCQRGHPAALVRLPLRLVNFIDLGGSEHQGSDILSLPGLIV